MKINFEQDEVIAAAGRAWHKSEPAIIQQDGFPIASIAFKGESANSYAGYGVIMDFQITDSEGKHYVAQIGKDMVSAAAETQFPDDFGVAKVAEDHHNLIPPQIIQRKMPEPNQFIKYLMAALAPAIQGDADDDYSMKRLIPQEEPQKPAPKPESFSKRLRREVRDLMNGTLANHGAFRTGPDGTMTVVWKREPGSSFVYIATSTCSPSKKDAYKEEVGARIAYKRMLDGQSISVPLFGKMSAEQAVMNMFGRFEEATQQSLWSEYQCDAKALREKYAACGLDQFKMF